MFAKGISKFGTIAYSHIKGPMETGKETVFSK